KNVSGSLRLDLASFRELEAFAQLGTDLDPVTQQRLDRGSRMVELLKQNQYVPLEVGDQIMVIFAGTNGYLDKIPVADVRRWESEFLAFMHDSKAEVCQLLQENLQNGAAMKDKDNEVTIAVRNSIEEFGRR